MAEAIKPNLASAQACNASAFANKAAFAAGGILRGTPVFTELKYLKWVSVQAIHLHLLE